VLSRRLPSCVTTALQDLGLMAGSTGHVTGVIFLTRFARRPQFRGPDDSVKRFRRASRLGFVGRFITYHDRDQRLGLDPCDGRPRGRFVLAQRTLTSSGYPLPQFQASIRLMVCIGEWHTCCTESGLRSQPARRN
jgi:hypothetical protein